jgi:hypothetical protein
VAATVVAVVVTALGILAVAVVMDGTPRPGDPMTALAWFYPFLALLAALMLSIGVLAGRVPGIATIVLLVAAPLLVTALPAGALELAGRVPSSLAAAAVDLFGTYVPFLIAGALLPHVLDARIRVGSGPLAVVAGIGGAAFAVWLSGEALRYLSQASLGPGGDTLPGAALMLAATAVLAVVSAAARGRPLVGLVAAGSLVVMWVAAALALDHVLGLAGGGRLVVGVVTTLCSQIWFTVAGILALPRVGVGAEPDPG